MWALMLPIIAALLILFDEAPYAADDSTYIFMISGTMESLDIHERISSLGDIINSMVWHWRNYGNGRIVPHSLLEAANLFPPIWAPLNTLMLFLIPVLIGKISGKRFTLPVFLVITALYWLTNPSPKSMIIWRAGSVNYLWCSVGALFAVYLWQRLPEWRWRAVLPAITAAFLLGNGNESVTIGLAAAFLCLLLQHRRPPCWRRVFFLAAFAAGIAANVFSPAALGRLNSMGSLGERLLKSLEWDWNLAKGSFLPILLLTAAAAAVLIWKKPWRNLVSMKHAWPLVAAVVCALVVNYSGNVFERSMYGVFFFMFIYAVQVLLPYAEGIRGRIPRFLLHGTAAAAVCLFALIVIVSCRQAVRNHERDLSIVEYCRNHPGQVCIVPRDKPCGCIMRWKMGGNRYGFTNVMMAKYYHVPGICCRDEQAERKLQELLRKAGPVPAEMSSPASVGNEAIVIPLPEGTQSVGATYSDGKKHCRIDTATTHGREVAVVWLPQDGAPVSINIKAAEEKHYQVPEVKNNAK